MSIALAVAPLVLALASTVAVTAATEVVVAGLLGLRTPYELAIVALANLATNPLVNLALGAVMALARARSLAHPVALAAVALLELATLLAEWRIYTYALPGRRAIALRVSAVANIASLAVGLAVFGIGAPLSV